MTNKSRSIRYETHCFDRIRYQVEKDPLQLITIRTQARKSFEELGLSQDAAAMQLTICKRKDLQNELVDLDLGFSPLSALIIVRMPLMIALTRRSYGG